MHLDSHSDIRSRYMSVLLQTLLDNIIKHGCDHFSRDNLVALLCAAKRLLLEISRNVSVVEPESKFVLCVLLVSVSLVMSYFLRCAFINNCVFSQRRDKH